MQSKFLTIDEVAKYLRLNKMKLYRLAQHGDIPAYKFGREWRFRMDRIEQWVEKQEVSKKNRKNRKI